MESRDRQVLDRILSETDLIADILSGHDVGSFLSDEKTKRAACMTLINIGELVKALSDDIRSVNVNVPWRAVAGLRDVTAHRYQTLRMEDIWETCQTDIPLFKEQITEMLSQEHFEQGGG